MDWTRVRSDLRTALGLLSVLVLSSIGTITDAASLPGGTLDPNTIPKYNAPMLVPPAMPYTAGTNTDFYEIAVREFSQQVLPPTLPTTTVWGYGSINPSSIFNFPSLTIEAVNNRPVQVKWINDLVDPGTGDCLPHLLPVDQTLHWANPLGPRDSRGTDQSPYTGPVPMVTHVHGAETNQESDGYPEAWYLPNCSIPGDVNFTTGTLYNTFKASSAVGDLWEPGATVFTYPNEQRAATLWYHDHALGMTRLNVYAGPAGFYLLRGGPDDQVGLLSGGTATLPGPAPAVGDGGGPYYEIPIAIQERSFNSDGSLFYPDNRAFFQGVTPAELNIPFIPEPAINGQPSDISPVWIPEFFGNVMVVNGNTWPYLEVEQRRYRIRFLNGNQSRFLILTTDTTNTASNAMTPMLTFWQIGAEGGFLPAPAAQTQLLIAPAERADVIVDFTGFPVGTNITLLNIGPDEPFGGGSPYFDCATDPFAPAGCFEPSDRGTTGQVMQFRVVAINGTDDSTPPDQLVLPARTPLPAPTVTRYISLNEAMSMSICVEQDPVTETYVVPINEVPCTDPNAVPFGPSEALLGTVDPVSGIPTALLWMDTISETPLTGATEVWEIWNFTEDAHPIHIHQVQFEVLGREVQGNPGATSAAGSNLPLPWEAGTKDTVIVYPGEIARVKATFSYPGLFVWHCHILEHEDNEMMRPYCVANADGTLPMSCGIANLMGDEIGVYRQGTWYLDVNRNRMWEPMLDDIVHFGSVGDVSVTGDWNGDGTSDAGVFFGSGMWRLDTNGNGIYEPGVDAEFVFGLAGDIPVAGDWNGDGTTDVGVFRSGVWYLDTNGNHAWNAGIDVRARFGIAGDLPVTGDWGGDGITDLGVFRGTGSWYLDTNENRAWNPGIDTVSKFGLAGDVPVTGDWSGDGITDIGVFRGGYWYLDLNGSRSWNKGIDLSFKFGIAGDRPVAGRRAVGMAGGPM